MDFSTEGPDESTSGVNSNEAAAKFDAQTASLPESIGEDAAPVNPVGSGAGATQPGQVVAIGTGIPIEALKFVLSLPFNAMARAHGEHWLLTQEEKDGIGLLAKPVADKWLPKDLGPEYLLAIALSGAIGIRMAKDKAQKSKDTKPDSSTGNITTENSAASPLTSESVAPESQPSWPSASLSLLAS